MKMGWAVVTGSAKGLGKEIALLCASLGFNVVIHASHSVKEGEIVQKKCQQQGVLSELFTADFNSQDDIDVFSSKCQELEGGVSLLVNNVGVYYQGLCKTQ